MTTDDEEVWKPIPDWPKYAVSNLGRVMRIESSSNSHAGRILKPKIENNGYLRLRLHHEGKTLEAAVHRLVAIAFLGKKPGFDVCHNDDDPLNCRLENLRYDTRKGNMSDCVKHGRTSRGERRWNSVLTEDKVREVKKLLNDGEKITTVSRYMQVSVGAISNIKHGRAWAWLS